MCYFFLIQCWTALMFTWRGTTEGRELSNMTLDWDEKRAHGVRCEMLVEEVVSSSKRAIWNRKLYVSRSSFSYSACSVNPMVYADEWIDGMKHFEYVPHRLLKLFQLFSNLYSSYWFSFNGAELELLSRAGTMLPFLLFFILILLHHPHHILSHTVHPPAARSFVTHALPLIWTSIKSSPWTENGTTYKKMVESDKIWHER